jgi:O-acetyl-ADP-ribose deacetylase (regulator of RNase III)
LIIALQLPLNRIGITIFERERDMLELTTGNLLEADTEALVNTVNSEGVMGKGVALQFKKKFPDMFDAYLKACKDGLVQPGKMHVYERREMINPRYIINFPTKRHWRSRSRMEDIRAGLAALVEEIERRNIKSLALPPLGCGNGGLDWNEVLPAIKKALSDLPGVRVLVYPPAGAPEAVNMVPQGKRPEMTASRAIILKIWEQYFVLGYQLTLLEVHKLLYLLQEAGEPLRLRFVKDHYGPYADNLRHVLHLFEGHFSLGFGDGRNKPDTQIELLPNAVEEADRFLNEHRSQSDQSVERLRRVKELIAGFESPYGMELLATIHWAATHETGIDSGLSKVTRVVREWNPRKHKLMKLEHVELAWKRLHEQGWVA